MLIAALHCNILRCELRGEFRSACVVNCLLVKRTAAPCIVLCCQMSVIFCDAGLSDIRPPCVVQSFINHNGRLFKVFVVGRRHFVTQRPSIKNLFAGGTDVSVLCYFNDLQFCLVLWCSLYVLSWSDHANCHDLVVCPCQRGVVKGTLLLF